MSYPSTMQDSLNLVVASRERRMTETFARATAEAKEALLKGFHPDYLADTFSALRIGPNAGDRTPRELALLLEADSTLPEVHGLQAPVPGLSLDKPDYDCDVLIIGGGGAGCSAAIMADNAGAKVMIATKLRLGDANTMMAQGGIQAADKDVDSPAIHYLDVMGGGHFVNTPDLVEALVSDAPEAIAWLEDLGAMFDKNPDGSMKTIHGGGTSRRRMHTARDYTGAEIMRTLRDEVRSRNDITLLEFSPAVELLTDAKGAVTGAALLNLNLNQYSVVRAKVVIIATGGSGRLHYQGFPTSNHYGATGDGLVLAYRAGAHLAFIDTMQYHPTGAAYPQQILGLLVTEKVRSIGAQLVNSEGDQFIFPLETRDVVASAIIRECSIGKCLTTPTAVQAVWLDTPMIEIRRGPGTVKRELPAMVRQFGRHGIDIAKEPMLVYPTLHYQNGGVEITADCATNVPDLLVAGEASGGVHGRNRLMGNSLLDVVVFGRRAGVAAARLAKERTGDLQLGFTHLDRWRQEMKAKGLASDVKSPLLLPDYTRKS
jgi:succinate dehydrogenase / fumarate reductase flavoprotein subunit